MMHHSFSSFWHPGPVKSVQLHLIAKHNLLKISQERFSKRRYHIKYAGRTSAIAFSILFTRANLVVRYILRHLFYKRLGGGGDGDTLQQLFLDYLQQLFCDRLHGDSWHFVIVSCKLYLWQRFCDRFDRFVHDGQFVIVLGTLGRGQGGN